MSKPEKRNTRTARGFSLSSVASDDGEGGEYDALDDDGRREGGLWEIRKPPKTSSVGRLFALIC